MLPVFFKVNRARLVRSQLDADPPSMQADPTLLKQALLNLMINATQAMAGEDKSGHNVHEVLSFPVDRC